MKFFSLLSEGNIHQSDGSKLISKDDYSKLIESSEILEKARLEGEKLLEKTQEECKEYKAEAKKQGFEEGLKQFNVAAKQMDEEVKSLRIKLQKLVLPIALKAAKRIVAKELETSPETIVDIVSEKIQQVSESRQVIIFVSKRDKEHLDNNKPKIKEILQQVETFAIQERDDIEPGGCIIKTESGMINATIESQWRALEQAFERYNSKL